MKYILPTLVLTGALFVTPNIMAQTSTEQGGMSGPPEGALTACAAAVVNDTCTFETPRGSVEGICSIMRDSEILSCRPEGGREGQGERQQSEQGSNQGGGMGGGQGGSMSGPPEGALTACATAVENDTCTFESPRGSVEGVCSPMRDSEELACRREGGRGQGGGMGGGMGGR